MKKTGRLFIALLAMLTLTFGNFVNSETMTVEAKTKTSETIESTSLGSDWKSGVYGYQAGCAVSEWLGLFECHSSQVPW